MQFTFFFGLKLVGEGLREDSNTGYPHGKNQVMPLNYKALDEMKLLGYCLCALILIIIIFFHFNMLVCSFQKQ